jgi:hypothetical protein
LGESFIKTCSLIGISLVLIANCGWTVRKVKVDEEFTLHPNEKVRLAGADLTIQLAKKESVGRQWYVNGRPEAPYARLLITTDGTTVTKSLTLGDSSNAGDYYVKLIAANLDHNDGGPDCKLVITRH